MSNNISCKLLKDKNIYFKLNLLLSITALVFALFVEYGLGQKPCILCIYQRVPYFLVALLSSFYFLAPAQCKNILNFNIAIYAICASVAAYHFAIEQGVVQETSSCTNHIVTNIGDSITDIEQAIYNTAATSCKEVGMYLLGASMAFWNIIAGAILSYYSLIVRKAIIS